jgi:hypothetical protein
MSFALEHIGLIKSTTTSGKHSAHEQICFVVSQSFF